VAGTNPKRAGTDVEGIPVYASMREAVAATDASGVVHTSCPRRALRRGSWKRPRAGIEFIVVITEGVPAQDEARFYNACGTIFRTCGCWPELPGHHHCRRVQHRHHRQRDRNTGRPGRIVSRSGTLTYQALYELTQKGIGQTTCVGIGGDPVPGTTFIRLPGSLRGRPGHQGRDHDWRDRWLRGGEGGRVHRFEDDQAGRRLYRRRDRAAG